MNAKISVLIIFVEAIIYLLLYNLHDCTFKIGLKEQKTQELAPFGKFVTEVPIFAAANIFFSWIWYSYGRTGFCSELFWKHELNIRSSHWSSSVKKVFLKIVQISQENTFAEVSF